jgi:hypothetical protein
MVGACVLRRMDTIDPVAVDEFLEQRTVDAARRA